MTNFKNPKRMSGSSWEWANPLGLRTVQGLTTALLMVASSAAVDAKIIYVNGSIPASGDGTSWATSYKYLQDALSKAALGDDVYLTKGIYYPDDSIVNPLAKGDREEYFQLNGVNLYGGFDATVTNPAARIPDPNPNFKPPAVTPGDAGRTILSGAMRPTESEYSLHVIKMTSNSTLDGLTVQSGNANGRGTTNNQGGGCWTEPGTTLTLNKVEFRNNIAVDSGGGVWGTVVAADCRFTKNSVVPDTIYSFQASGGAIKGDAVVKDCTFVENTATSRSLGLAQTGNLTPGGNTQAEGGAIAGVVTAKNCDFELNFASATCLGPTQGHVAVARGGAIFGTVSASKCRFKTNRALSNGGLTLGSATTEEHRSYGGAIAGKFTIESSVFVSNGSSLCFPEVKVGLNPTDLVFAGGGALATSYDGTPIPSNHESRVNNSVFSDNTSQLRGGAAHCARNTKLILQNSTFVDNGTLLNTRGCAVSCGGEVTFLNNIFAVGIFTSLSSLSLTSTTTNVIYFRDKFITVLGGGGAMRTSVRENPTDVTYSKNLMNVGFPHVPQTAAQAALLITTNAGAEVLPGTITIGFVTGDARFVGTVGLPTAGVQLFSKTLEGPDGIWGTADDRLRLQPATPGPPVIPASFAINAGQILGMAKDTLDIDGDGDLSEDVPADLAGFTRVQPAPGSSPLPDLGAYEFGTLTHAPEIQIFSSDAPFTGVLVDNSATPTDLTAYPEVAKTFKIENLGPANLNGLQVSVSGDVADYVITQPVQTTVLPSGFTTFQVKFSPKSSGAHAATIIVKSDDADENPFEIKVTGSSLQPELDIEQPVGTNLVSLTALVDFGPVGDFGNASKVFTIKNPGSKILNLQGVAVEGANAKDFIVSGLGTTAVGITGSTTFTVTFRPADGGVKNATLVIISDDGDENPFKINVRGSAPLSEIVVEQAGGVDVVDGITTIDYDKTGYLATTVKVFTIRNIGLGHLTIPSIVSSGPNASDFVVSAPVSSVVLPGGTTTFTLRYRPSASGVRNALITIVNDDPDAENPFTIAVTGNSLLSPKIAIRQPFLPDMVDGGFNSFGTVKKGLLYTKKFTIRNDGNGVLKGIAVKMTGAKSFTHTIPSATVLNTGESVSFKVTFKPKTAGVMTANLQVISNDLEFSPFDIALSGRGVAKKRKKSMASEPLALATTRAGNEGKISATSSSKGPKYLVLTLAKSGNNVMTGSDVEVSSNLVDWFSGDQHTKTLVDSDTVLEVRDGVPITAGEKRYIRLKPKAN